MGHAVQSCMCPNGKVMEHRSSWERSNLSNPHSHRPKEEVEEKRNVFARFQDNSKKCVAYNITKKSKFKAGNVLTSYPQSHRPREDIEEKRNVLLDCNA